MENVIESYLVKLGFEISQPELNKFKGALKEAGTAAEKHTSGIVQQFIKWQSAIVGAFSAVGLSTVAMMSKVADADLGFQKQAQMMSMSTRATRELTIAQKVLGITLADATWNAEQRGRLRHLMGIEQRYLEPGLAPDFENNMEHIRSISNEFKYMQSILVYISMELTDKLYKALDGDSFLAKLQHFTEWFAMHSKEISDWLARVLVPSLRMQSTSCRTSGRWRRGWLARSCGSSARFPVTIPSVMGRSTWTTWERRSTKLRITWCALLTR